MTPIHQLYEHLYVAGQLQESDFAELSAQGVKTIINNRPDAEESAQLDHESAAKLAQLHGIAYHYLPMANGQPLPDNLVSDFKAILEATQQPVLAHCRSGMRSSFIWALGQISAGKISVDDALAAAHGAGIPLHNARSVLESVAAT